MTVDVVTTEIVRNLFLSAADDMLATLVRSAFQPLIYENGDAAVALLDRNADVLGQSSGLPLFLGSLDQAVKEAVRLRGGKIGCRRAISSSSTTPISRGRISQT
ncbi:hypothetical protein BLJAPNOD_01479 [Ensifer sp. M14]|uniref:hydantoinase B/oxoprolinase family protein n=1 Tax=Ensifer sp. M14 TaxID=2203782 RepID=UPI000E1D1EB3|nr:hydantoinase B/oxoprolinase family protein [Ensifer sp. M14]RDL50358.1 hypothetical protein BLJAPNOD_01479 [Ensifer sp. M14]